MAIQGRSSRGEEAGSNRYRGVRARIWGVLVAVLALPAAATLWGGALAVALVVPAAPAMVSHLLIGLVAVGVRRRQVARALAEVSAGERRVWRWTPIQWGSFALSKRRGLASACASIGVAHGGATLALIVASWDDRWRALPWGAALPLAALSGLVISGLYADFLLGRYAPVEVDDSVDVWLSPRAVCFNGDALRLAGEGYSVRAIETRPGPPGWLVLHVEQPDKRVLKIPLPVPDNDPDVLADMGAWLEARVASR